MSRRRVSVRDLGQVDCEGWLLRRTEARSFLSSRWKRRWFVLKKSSLYWYQSQTAEKADGFVNLSGFTVQQAKHSRKKHVITASHPLVVTILMAAESFTDMNKWISKLCAAAEPCELIDAEECYSEGSDQDCDDECVSTSCSLDPEQETTESGNEDALQSSSCTPTCGRRSGATLSRNRRTASDGGEHLTRLDLPGPGANTGASLPLIHVGGGGGEEVVHEKPPDEMESLYKHLKAASLSPVGRSSRRDFRASFVRRSQNDKVNEKLHLLRILSSTLKAKESELQAVEQVLTNPTLTPPTYRKWRLSNSMLLQEIRQHNQAAGGAAELTPPDTSAQCEPH